MKAQIRCPRCQQKGTVAPELAGQVISCPNCDHAFTANLSFWQRQQMASPIFRYWWLLPAIILAVLVYLGGLPLWIALAVVIIALLAIIARRLAVLVKK